MELVAAATLYGLFSAWLLLPLFGVPRMLTTATATLMWLEFLAVLTWGYASEGCARRPCSALAEAAATAASVDLPALSLVVIGLSLAHAIRLRRRSRMPRARRREAPGPSER